MSFRFEIAFDQALPQGLVMIGEVTAGQAEFEYQSYAFRATGFEAAGSGSKPAHSATTGEAATKAA